MKTVWVMRTELEAAGYFVGKRRADVVSTFEGAYMVCDPLDLEQGYKIVGDDLDELIADAHKHLIESSK